MEGLGHTPLNFAMLDNMKLKLGEHGMNHMLVDGHRYQPSQLCLLLRSRRDLVGARTELRGTTRDLTQAIVGRLSA